VLEREDSDSVIEPYLRLACDAGEMWAPDSRRAELCAAVAATCRRLAGDDSRRTVALRALARVAPDLDAVADLQAHAGADIDLHWRALVRKAELGGDVAAECRTLRERDPDPDAWTREMAVRAAIPSAEAKQAAWQAMAVERRVAMQEMTLVSRTFWRPGQEAALAPFVPRYRAMLAEFGDGGMLPGMVLTRALFPVFAVAERDIAELEDAARDGNPVVRKTLLERADEVRRMLRARQRTSGIVGT
jgi:aminopeptidase N